MKRQLDRETSLLDDCMKRISPGVLWRDLSFISMRNLLREGFENTANDRLRIEASWRMMFPIENDYAIDSTDQEAKSQNHKIISALLFLSPAATTANISARKCYKCGSMKYIKANCPQRKTTTTTRRNTAPLYPNMIAIAQNLAPGTAIFLNPSTLVRFILSKV